MLQGIPEETTPRLFTGDGIDAKEVYLVRPQEVGEEADSVG